MEEDGSSMAEHSDAAAEDETALYTVGDRICLWFGDSVDCGVIQEVDDRFDVLHYETLMDTLDGAPYTPHQSWTLRADDDIWLERDGPSKSMQEKIRHWYRGTIPEGLLGYLS